MEPGDRHAYNGPPMPGSSGYPATRMMLPGMPLNPVPPFLPYPPIPPIGFMPTFGYPRLTNTNRFLQFNSKPKSTPVTCDICHMTLNSQTVYETHLKGKVHQKNLKIIEGKIASMGELVNATVTATALAAKKTKIVYKSQTILTRKKTKTISDSSYFNKCDVCNKSVNSKRQWEIHLAGSKHQRNVLTSKAKFDPKSLTVEGSSTPPTENREKPAETTELVDKDIEVVTVTLPRGIIVVDEESQRFICDYCERKVMNSIYQVDQHVQSSEHLKRSGSKDGLETEKRHDRPRKRPHREDCLDRRHHEDGEGFDGKKRDQKNSERICRNRRSAEGEEHRKRKLKELSHLSRQSRNNSRLPEVHDDKEFGQLKHPERVRSQKKSSSSCDQAKRDLLQSSRKHSRHRSLSHCQDRSLSPPHRQQSPICREKRNRRNTTSPLRWHHDKFEEDERFHADMADAAFGKFEREKKHDPTSLERHHHRKGSLERERDPVKIKRRRLEVVEDQATDWAERRFIQLASVKRSDSERNDKFYTRDNCKSLDSETHQDNRRKEGDRRRKKGNEERSDFVRGNIDGITDSSDRTSISLKEHLKRDHPHWIEALNKVEEQRQLVREFRGEHSSKEDRDWSSRRNRRGSPDFNHRSSYTKSIHENFVRGGIQNPY